MTGGEAVVKSLEAANVSVVFGIPGSHNLAIYDALAKSEKYGTCSHDMSREPVSWPMDTPEPAAIPESV